MSFQIKESIRILLVCFGVSYILYSVYTTKNHEAAVLYSLDCPVMNNNIAPAESIDIRSAIKPLPYTEWTYDASAIPPRFCVIVRTVIFHQSKLYALMMSLLTNRPPSLQVFLVNTDASPFPSLQDMTEHANHMAGSQIFHDVTHLFNASSARDRFGDVNFDRYGFVVTDMVMEHILQLPDQCEYLLITNGDNLYGNGFFPAVWEKIREGFNAIGVHFISHYEWAPPPPDQPCGSLRGGADLEVRSAIKRNCMDMGGAVFSLSLVRNIRLVITEMVWAKVDTTRSQSADGYFFDALMQQDGARGVIIPRVLMIHQ